MKVIVEIDHSVSRDEIQNWIDDVLMNNPAIYSAHIACNDCTCDKTAIPLSKEFRDKNKQGMAKASTKGEVNLLKSDLVWHDLKKNPDDLPIAKDMKVDTPFWRVILKNNKSGEIIDIVCLQHSISDTEYICKNIYNCEKEELKFNMAEYTSILRDYYPIG